MLKRVAVALLAVMLCLSGCSVPPKGHDITVVAAIFPEYDWVRQILGPDSRIQLQLLVDDGVDPHSFQPTVSDMVTVANCDLLIYGGGESDEWLEDVISERPDSDRIVLELLPTLGENAHTAQNVAGMQTREEGEETDEHVWLSLRNAAFFCKAIADALCTLDPQNAQQYQNNLEAYLKKLDELDCAYQQTVKHAQKDTIVVCDRFPFRYLVEDYGLQYYAAFPGCSAESGASFQTVIFLADQVKRLALGTVLTVEGSDGRIARTVAENSGLTNVGIQILDSMQSVSLKDARNRTYLQTMEQNRLVLEAALN